MSYIALYRKYRPQFFKDIVGQTITVTTLQNTVIYQKISHCYLFSGNKGTGKTTVAKIFAKTINCLNLQNGDCCGVCKACGIIDQHNSDLVEIDGASYNGIEEIRDLKSKINYKSSVLKYKVYIIDEVHVLTMNAFNALLKILEEPPKHVIFIFATTEIHKIPETILSRTQSFNFLNISNSFIFKKLKQIVDLEKISITDEALEKVTFYAQGSMRDALNLLDQVNSYQTNLITIQDIYDVKGKLSDVFLFKLLELFFNEDLQSVIKLLRQIIYEGKNITYLFDDLILILKNFLLENFDHSRNPQNVIKNFSITLAHLVLQNLVNYQQFFKHQDFKDSYIEVIFILIFNDVFSLNNQKNQNFLDVNNHPDNNDNKNQFKEKVFRIIFNNNEEEKRIFKKYWHKLKSYSRLDLKEAAFYLFQGSVEAVYNKEMLLVYHDNDILQKVLNPNIKKQILLILNSKACLIVDYVPILKKFFDSFNNNINKIDLENIKNPVISNQTEIKDDKKNNIVSSESLIVSLAKEIFGTDKIIVKDE